MDLNCQPAGDVFVHQVEVGTSFTQQKHQMITKVQYITLLHKSYCFDLLGQKGYILSVKTLKLNFLSFALQ